MKNPFKRGIEVSITLKNNKAQIILAIALLILSIGIAFSFFNGSSFIHVNKACSDSLDTPISYLIDNTSTNNIEILE